MDFNNSEIETHSPSLLSPPNEEEYTSLARAELAVKEHAMQWALSIGRSLLKIKARLAPRSVNA